MITLRYEKVHARVIPILNVILILDKDENAINNGKHVLFHLSKCSIKLYKMQTEMGDFIQVPPSLHLRLYLPQFQIFDFQDFLGVPCSIARFCFAHVKHF